MSRERFKRGNHRVVCDYDENDKLVSGELYLDGELIAASSDVEQVLTWLKMPVTP